MIGRADIEGSKSNVAMNAWLPQTSYRLIRSIELSPPPPAHQLRPLLEGAQTAFPKEKESNVSNTFCVCGA